MGAIPTISTVATGAIVTSAYLNSLKAAADFWALTPRCSVYHNATSSMTSGTSTWLAIPFQAEVFDVVQSGDSPMHDNSTNNSRVYARTAGKYEITGQLQVALNATGYRSVQIRLNAAGSSSGGTQLALNVADASSAAVVNMPVPVIEVDLSPGDYVEMFGQQNSGGALNTVAGSGITFLRVKLTGT